MIVVTNAEHTKASLKPRSTLLRRSFYDATKYKLDVLSQPTMRNAREDRVRFRRGSQLDVVKSVWSNKKEVILLFLLCKIRKTKEQHPGFQRSPPP